MLRCCARQAEELSRLARPVQRQKWLPRMERHDSEQHPRFSNHFAIGFNEEEFLLQFGLMYEGQPAPRIHTTVITTPRYARKLLALLRETIDEHESRPGKRARSQR